MASAGYDLSQFDISKEVMFCLSVCLSASLFSSFDFCVTRVRGSRVVSEYIFVSLVETGEGQACGGSDALCAVQDSPELGVSDQERGAHSVGH